ncbi:MAG TPA: hypothetical protein VG738_05015 [Chitinophagaceae bacterium]|nr:hypothetical protein [Chitinophagaceae bacterium]
MAKAAKQTKKPKKAKYDTSIKVNAKPDELLSVLLTTPAKKKK